MAIEDLAHVPREFMPTEGTKDYLLLELLSDGENHSSDECASLVGHGLRSPLQKLEEKPHGYWLIHNVGNSKGAIYRLDSRHLEGTPQIDCEARREAERIALNKKKNNAQSGANRLPQVSQELDEFEFQQQQNQLDFGSDSDDDHEEVA